MRPGGSNLARTFSPFLKMSVAFALFQSAGILLCSMHLLKTGVCKGAIYS